MNKFRLPLLVLIALVMGTLLIAQGPLTPLMNLRGRTDANGYLITSNGVYTGPDGPLTALANLRGRTDANGYLLTTFGSGGSTSAIPISINGIAAVSTDALLLQNTTASTSGVPVQMSPRARWCGSAYNSVSTLSETDCYYAEVLPATNAGTTSSLWKLFSTINGGAPVAVLAVSNSGNITAAAAITGTSLSATSGASTAAGGFFNWSTRTVMRAPADGLTNVLNSSEANGPQINSGTASPTVTTCGTGAPTAHSTNTAGEITATGATTCTVTFGAPNFTNQPFCTVTDETTIAALRISAISVSTFTVTGLTSNDKFMYVCFGGV